MSTLGIKKNHKKGISAAAKQRRREEAEVRNAEYQSLPYKAKVMRNSTKVMLKLKRSLTE